MEWMVRAAPWLAGGVVLALAAIMFRRQLERFFALLARTGVGLAVLAASNWLLGAIGVGLGVNLTNAVVLALLGVPGFGLLLMLNWVLQ